MNNINIRCIKIVDFLCNYIVEKSLFSMEVIRRYSPEQV